MNDKHWITVDPKHCHQRLKENTLIEKLRVISPNKNKTELLLRFIPEDLGFFFDHEIDHLPGMLEVCSLRQSALAVGHLVYDIPMNYMMVLDWINVRLFCFSELNVDTTAELELLSMKEDKNKIEIILNGHLIQDGNVLMTMKGKMVGFSPRIADRVRRVKVPQIEVVKQESVVKHAEEQMIEIHLIAEHSRFGELIPKLQSLLSSKICNKYQLLPLYFSYDENDFEIRICATFQNPKLLGDFIVDKIRTLAGIKSSQVRLTLDGNIFQSGLLKLTNLKDDVISSHIFIKVNPACDSEAWQSLSNLTEEDGVFPTWCMRDFYDYNRDISLRLMGDTKESILRYIETRVKSIKGLEVTNIKFMSKLVKIQDDSILLEIASKWISSDMK
ncbi:MAG: hypothetical protein HQL15_07210 [Candidatus Omnitrophica bacterium]|nr:hypothetical protein [Candidatus Omnitrophota bacterium]